MSVKEFVKKNVIAVSIGAALLGGGAVALGLHLFDEQDGIILSTAGVAISEQEIKEIVSKQTGIADLLFDRLDLERDGGYPNPYYEVEAYKDGVEYNFEIDAVTGEILSQSTDNEAGLIPNTQQATTTSNAGTATTLSEDDVKKIATETTGKSDLSFPHIALKTDDGVQVYDVKAISGNEVFDLDIDAVSGQILSSGKAAIASTTNTTTTAKVTEDQAKEIAGKKAGIQNLFFTKIHLSQEADDYAGALYYDIQAYADGVEYEFDIDATTGQVLSSSAENAQAD